VDFEVLWTQRRGHAETLAREAVREGVGLVVAAGGDGTVHEVASGLLSAEAALGILPCGSGNGLARALGMPLDLRRACRALLTARVRRIDAGRVNARPFFATAGVGLDALVAARYEGSERRGLLPYVALTTRTFLTRVPEEVTLTLDAGPPLAARPILLTVANTEQYGGGAIIAPGARPDDGLLDICLIEDVPLFRALLHAPRLFTGAIHRMRGVRLFRAASVQIVRPAPGPLQMDGEALQGEAALSVQVLPGALKVAAPLKNS
jgi:YegS/Rv2252/BmrU family lipid kinase